MRLSFLPRPLQSVPVQLTHTLIHTIQQEIAHELNPRTLRKIGKVQTLQQASDYELFQEGLALIIADYAIRSDLWTKGLNLFFRSKSYRKDLITIVMSGTAESPAQIEYDPKIISDIIQGSLTDKGRATKLLQELYKYFGETGLSTLPSFWRDENGNLSLQQLQKSLQEQMNYVQGPSSTEDNKS